MSFFKYFTAEAHARLFIKRGAFLLRPLAYFRSVEDGAVRGDAQDGQLRHAPAAGLFLNREDGSAVAMTGHSFVATPAHEIFVFCASNQKSDELAQRFDTPFCVEISDPAWMLNRIKARADPASSLDYAALQSGAVDYRDPTKQVGVDWALPEKLVFIKPPAFAWQDEYRIAIGQRGTFDVHAIDCKIETGPVGAAADARPATAPPLRFRIGNLGDIAILHDLRAATAQR